jgi:hypothetical protein
MTLEQAEAARRRAVQMFARFNDPDAAAEFDGLTVEEYAERQGIEIVASNPGKLRRFDRRGVRPSTSTRKRREIAMASKTELEDTVRDIYDRVQESGSTRAEMGDVLEKIAGLCTEALPGLDSDDDSAEGDFSDEADDDAGE